MEFDEYERAKRFTVYKNGDKHYSGTKVLLNRRKIPNLDKLLDLLTQQTRANEAVRFLCTPQTGTRVRCLDDIADEAAYVAVGNSRFEKFGYTTIGKDDRRSCKNKENHVQKAPHAQGQRFLSRLNVISIRVFANGKEFDSEKRVILTKHMLKSWESVLGEITAKVRPISGAAKSLHTLDGQRVKEITDLTHDQTYVVVGTELGGFQKLDYGRRKPVFNLSPKLPRRYYLQPLEDLSSMSRKKSSLAGKNDILSDEEFFGDETSLDYVHTDADSTSDANKSQSQGQKGRKHKKMEAGDSEVADDGDVFHVIPGRKPQKKQALEFKQGQDDVFHAKHASADADGASTVDDVTDNTDTSTADVHNAKQVPGGKAKVHSRSKTNANGIIQKPLPAPKRKESQMLAAAQHEDHQLPQKKEPNLETNRNHDDDYNDKEEEGEPNQLNRENDSSDFNLETSDKDHLIKKTRDASISPLPSHHSFIVDGNNRRDSSEGTAAVVGMSPREGANQSSRRLSQGQGQNSTEGEDNAQSSLVGSDHRKLRAEASSVVHNDDFIDSQSRKSLLTSSKSNMGSGWLTAGEAGDAKARSVAAVDDDGQGQGDNGRGQ